MDWLNKWADRDVAIKYLATVSLLINIIFGILFFGLSPDQTASSGEHHPQALSQSNFQSQDNQRFQVDLTADQSLQDYHQKLLAQGFTTDQTKPLIFSRLKAQYVDSIQRPDDQFWRHQPLSQINYMESMAAGYESIRGQLTGLYGVEISTDPQFADMFYPMANQYPFLSSSEQIAVQKMQIEIQKYSTQLQAEGGYPRSVPPERGPANMLANLLGEQATKEYMLRTSPLANKMRMSGLTFTEDSFRKAFDLLVSVQSVQSPTLTFAVRDEINEIFGPDDGLVLWAAIDPAFGLVKQVVTPLDMADTDDVAHHMVVNIIRLLQSLDKDSDPDNGITITQTAKDNAVFLDFDLSVVSFESQAGVTLFIGNAGQDVTPTDLVDTVLAMVHFVASLVLAGEIESEAEPVNNDSLVGTWEIASPTESDLFLLSLFEDGTYVHAEVNETSPSFLSGMEWGMYNVVGLGEITAGQTLDNNGDAGLSAFDGSGPRLRIIAQPSGSLMYSSDINNDGISDNTFGLRRVDSDGILGTWLSTTTENDLLMLVFFDDGTYFHGEVDEDDNTEISGMELGTYEHDEATGLMTVTTTFDKNGSTGLTDFVGIGAPNIFVEVVGDTLTATIDEDGDGLIDETIVFQRQHL